MAADAKLKPTPTIEEMQRSLAGETIDEHEHDGSPYQDMNAPLQNKVATADQPGANYKTRAAQQQK